MSFRKLYDFVQTQNGRIKRNDLRDKALELTGIEKINVLATSLDTGHCRGFFLSSTNTDIRFVQQFGTDVIVLPRNLDNRCWERFIFVKELMHIFDSDEEKVKSGDVFQKLLEEINNPTTKNFPQRETEYRAFWRGLSCLCPEKLRVELGRQRDARQISDYDIALTLRIPQAYVRRLYEDRYHGLIEI